MNQPATRSPPRRPRRWLGFFLILAILAAIAIVVPIVYNLSIQLRPEQLAEARRLWQEHDDSNYDLEYLIQVTDSEGEEKTQYEVKVRDGRTMSVTVNGEPLGVDPALAPDPGVPSLSSEVAKRFGVPALFDEIEAALRRDAADSRRNFATAQFDPKDGHPFHYVHRVRGTRERVEWNIKMRRHPASARSDGF